MPKRKKAEKSNNGNTRSNRTKSISSLIEARKWFSVKEKLIEIDFSTPTTATISASTNDETKTPLLCMGLTGAGLDTESSNKKNDETVLHTSCRHQPPLEIIKLIIDKFPISVSTRTLKEKQYPLHIAATYGAHPGIISLLIEKHPSAASSSDHNGKTPLHLACESYHFTFREEKDPHRGGKTAGATEGNQQQKILDMETAMLQTVRIMTKNSPEIVNIHDDEDMTALEYAICSNIPLPVVQSIQRASERFFKLQKEKSLSNSILKTNVVAETTPSSQSKQSSDRNHADEDRREENIRTSDIVPTNSE